MAAVFTFDTFLVIGVTVMIICTNIFILFVACWTNCFKDFNKIFLLSMVIADLCLGLFITPFAVFTSLYDSWVYGSEKFCHWQAYTVCFLWISGFYSLTWLNVDHYVAIRKPQRYSSMMSPQRSLCWIAFAWLIPVGFCCPPLFALQGARYYDSMYLCLIEAKFQKAYFITSGALMILPAGLALFITNVYLFTPSFHEKRQVYDKILIEHEHRPWNYHIGFVLSIVCVFVWFPWCFLQILDLSIDINVSLRRTLNFYFLWFAMGNSCFKFFVFLALSIPFRRGLVLCIFKNECPCRACQQLRGGNSTLSLKESSGESSNKENL